MGPLLLARLMNLNEVQEGVMTIAFHVADKDGLPLVDLDDLQAMLVNIGERADELTLEYGNVSKMSVGAIQRSLLQLRAQGGDPLQRSLVGRHDRIEARTQLRVVVEQTGALRECRRYGRQPKCRCCEQQHSL